MKILKLPGVIAKELSHGAISAGGLVLRPGQPGQFPMKGASSVHKSSCCGKIIPGRGLSIITPLPWPKEEGTVSKSIAEIVCQEEAELEEIKCSLPCHEAGLSLS